MSTRTGPMLPESPSLLNLHRTASETSTSSEISGPQSPTPRRDSLFAPHTAPIPSRSFGGPGLTNAIPASPQSPTRAQFNITSTPSLSTTPPKHGSKLPSLRSFPTRSTKLVARHIRRRTSPKSPLRPVFAAKHDSGNSAVPGTPAAANINNITVELDDVENADAYARLFSKSNSSANQRHSIHVDPSGSSRQLATRHLESTHNSLLSVTSPLKRNDVSMDVDRTASSPLPKRRSLHGASGQGSDISVEPLDISRYLQTQSYEILDEASAKKDQDAEKTADALAAPAAFAPPTRKASSLRRSALQLSLDSQSPLSKGSDSPRGSSRPETISRNSRPRPRVSDSHFIEPLPRGSPFPSPANLPPASLHQMPSDRPSRSDHPLSRTLTQSSSGSSLPDSPTHFPVHNPNPKPKPLLFSRSVPYGAARPRKEDVMPSSQGTETPDVKNDKPWAGAFYTAGLVSKMADMDKLDQYPVMPDTPCKKSFATYPADKILLRGKQIRHPFPMLTTPFHPAPTPSQETFGNGSRTIDIFNRPPTIGPKAAGSEGLEDDIGSGLSAFETFPPTPTRQTSLPPGGPEIDAGESPSSFRKSTLSLSAVGNGHDQGLSRSSCKSSPDEAPECRRRGGDPESPQMLDPCAKSASSVSSSSPPFSLPSFGRSRARRGPLYAPSPLKTAALKSIATASKKFSIAKASLVVPASPLESPVITTPSPHGPMMPPSTTKRPSLWSQNGAMPLALNLQRKTSFPPATPTSTRQNNPFSFKDRNVTPIGPRRDLDVDEFLAQRFRRVEKIGQGEFSTVFKVEGKSSSPSFSRSTSSALHNSSSPTPMAARDALAVKRVKKQRSSARYKEVDILRALRGRPHIIEFVDCWESEEHLYIVTEYCEESSLMLFLLPICKDSRLDDFRIWKILLEIGLGVKEIHDAGFLHLDLKPANILITFDGSLKIADFGMASVWPAARGVELEEGDREYVSPEVLNGHYDKPADMFSLGLILLELAGNCVLPGQGTTWQQLRHGDLSSVPSLTWSEESARESSTTSLSGLRRKSSSTLRFGQTSLASCRGLGDPIKAGRAELDAPPAFMRDADNEGSLDRLVPWMMSPKPEDRPTIHQVLAVEGISWVAGRRRSSATIYEGDWGPADSIVASDTEMMDV